MTNRFPPSTDQQVAPGGKGGGGESSVPPKPNHAKTSVEINGFLMSPIPWRHLAIENSPSVELEVQLEQQSVWLSCGGRILPNSPLSDLRNRRVVIHPSWRQ
ncbi:hypothetical protein TNIN_301191 [Trichonephila inaurata madagascariensis]|uniref:Uncharacterized protein n=1 Tax=Trichonephila inaurata madagascariensis TaxID=2747483 RepID=A0A8X7C793_9ARAC|nr:hypothetical protein TNIN_301191 [Trichonephila inaurata madagascariensis]